MLIKVLYVVLVLSFAALAGAALSLYLRIRRQMKQRRVREHEDLPKPS